MYYIYHIPGVKIGCTKQFEKRISAQGFTDYEILEQHEDGWIAGDRELELQKEYDYPVDAVHYMISLQNSGVRKNTQDREHQSRAGRIGGAAGKGKPKSKHKIITCPHCGKSGGEAGIKRHHFDKCKKRDT